MKSIAPHIFAAFLLALGCTTLQAQTSGQSHPLLSNPFYFSAGAYVPHQNLRISANGVAPGTEIDFDQAFDFGSNSGTWAANLRWRFGKKWDLQMQYWKVSESGGKTLDRDYEWRDVILQQGSFATAHVGFDVARAFFGRKFSASDSHEFGAGIGLHWLQLDASIEGQALTNVGNTSLYKDSVTAGFPLPDIGAWYIFSWSPQWAAQARVDWLSASVGDYSGGLWDASAGVFWQPWEHFGFALAWNYFSIDVDVKKDSWNGNAKITQSGPFLSLTATW